MNGVKSQFVSQGKALAIKTAKQMAREPYELIRKAPVDILGLPENKEQSKKSKEVNNKSEESQKEILKKEALDKEKSKRFTTALATELKDIQRQKLFEEILKKISEGETVNLEGLDLTIEQKQVLKAHMEVTRTRREQVSEKKTIVEPTTKPKRNLFAGAKTTLERMKRKSEIRMPPSG